jgi:hypothetical protein
MFGRVVILFALCLGVLLGSGADARAQLGPGIVTCIDDLDNDGDGRADFDDPDCMNPFGPGESTFNPPTVCEDGKDNDGDGETDYKYGTGDDGCSSDTDTDESDGPGDIERAEKAAEAAEALLPHLESYGADLVRLPVPDRLYAFKVHCMRVPCTVDLAAKTSGGYSKRLPALDDDDNEQLRVKVPTKNFAVWFEPSDFPAGKVDAAVRRYGAVRLRVTATLTDATGAVTTEKRTITLRAKRKPKPKKAPKPRTIRQKAADAVRSELERAYEISYPSVRCEQMTSTYFSCPWSGLTRADIRQGNTSGWGGRARVTRYGNRFDVVLGVERRGE